MKVVGETKVARTNRTNKKMEKVLPAITIKTKKKV